VFGSEPELSVSGHPLAEFSSFVPAPLLRTHGQSGRKTYFSHTEVLSAPGIQNEESAVPVRRRHYLKNPGNQNGLGLFLLPFAGCGFSLSLWASCIQVFSMSVGE